MRFDVSLVPKGDSVVTHFPQLSEHEEFDNPNNDELLRICILSTDENSPFVKSERDDYEKRLAKIFDYLGLKQGDRLVKLASGKLTLYEDMVNKYVMFIDNLAYAMWMNKLRLFYNIGVVLRQPIDMEDPVEDMKKRAALDKGLQDIYSSLLDYEAQVFPDVPTRKKLRQQVAKLLQPAEQYSIAKQVV